jgi:DNA-binding response OmpR family regulator
VAGRHRTKYTDELDARLREIAEEERGKTRRLDAGHKQKLTNRQIFEKVRTEGFDIGEATVNVALAKIRAKLKEVYIRQEYDYGDRYEFSLEPRENYLWSTTSVKCGWTVGRA